MGRRRCRSTIDATALVIHKVYKTSDIKQVTGVLLMDIKEAFDHVSRAKLAERMADLGIDNNLIGWT